MGAIFEAVNLVELDSYLVRATFLLIQAALFLDETAAVLTESILIAVLIIPLLLCVSTLAAYRVRS